MSDFSDRLKQERKRLGLNQDEFAALGGVKKGAQFNYENASRTPDVDYLMAIAAAGVDTQFLLFGSPSSNRLSEDEAEVLVAYRSLDVRGKARILGVLEGISEQEPTATKNQSNVVFHGKVGQQITGDITAPQTINMGRKKK